MASRICRLYRVSLTQTRSQLKAWKSGAGMVHFTGRGLATMHGTAKLSSVTMRKTERSTLAGENFRSFHASAMLQGVTSVKMPSLSPTMEEGTIVAWMKKEGDKISPGDVLCEIQTDKAVVSLEFDDEGILAKILKPADSGNIRVGSLIAVVVDEGQDWQNVEIPKEDVVALPTSKAPASATPSPPVSAKAPVHDLDGPPASEVLLGPAVRNLLKQYGLNLTQVQPTSGSRNLVKGDVLRIVKEQNLTPVTTSEAGKTTAGSGPSKSAAGKKDAPAAYKDLEITNMRRTIAKRLLQSKSTIPHAYITADSKIDHIINLRKRMTSAGLKVSINDFIIKSVANALGKCPSINIVLEGTEVVHKGQIDISVAVATESGLITPIVTDVAGRDILEISENVKELAEKAKKGKLQPHEFMGGTFTISNLGMFGIHHFTAIINPPQCAILAVGGGHTYLDEAGNQNTRLQTTLSYDARAITEVNASKFLAHLTHELENPSETSMGIYDIDSRLEIKNLTSS